MKLVYTKHARRRMAERGLTTSDIEHAIAFPERIDRSTMSASRFIIKAVYRNHRFGQTHLLMVICERSRKEVLVITIIDTSKITKYL